MPLKVATRDFKRGDRVRVIHPTTATHPNRWRCMEPGDVVTITSYYTDSNGRLTLKYLLKEREETVAATRYGKVLARHVELVTASEEEDLPSIFHVL